jgi:hypothetical protein
MGNIKVDMRAGLTDLTKVAAAAHGHYADANTANHGIWGK